jgi:glucokinase
VSRRAILARYLAGPNVTSTTGLDVHDVFDRSRGGEAWATQVLEDAFRALGGALVPWFTRFQATTVAFGGAMTGSWDLVLPPLRSGLTTAGARIDIELLPSPDTERSALIGAATYAPLAKACLSSGDDQSDRDAGAKLASAIPATPTPKEPQAP